MRSNTTKPLLVIIVLLATLGLSGSVQTGSASGALAAQTQVVPSATMSLLLNYQGRLLDPSTHNPKPDGTYTIAFAIYQAAEGGAAQWTEVKNVQIRDGLFSTLLGDISALPVGLFNGQDLWLGVKVGADPEATPRQQLLPMPYALYARNADMVDGQDASAFGDIAGVTAGAGLSGGGESGTVTISADTSYLQRRVSETCTSGNYVRAIGANGTVTCEPDRDTTYTAGSGLSLASGAFSVNLAGSGSAETVAHSDHNHNAAYVNEDQANSISSAMITNGAVTAADLQDGAVLAEILDDDGSGSGLDADLLDGKDSGAFADAVHIHWGASWAGAGTGLSLKGGGTGLTASGTARGVYGESTGGYGVEGLSTSSDGVHGKSSLSHGVAGESDSGDGTYGYSKDGIGAYGKSQTSYGGWFESTQDHNDLVLGGGVGRVNTDPTNPSSELILSSNRDVQVRLDNNGGDNAQFRIKNSGGSDVMTVDESGDLTASGKITADRVTYSAPRTHYYSAAGEAFVPWVNVDYANSGGCGGAYVSASGGFALVAGVSLPHGAVVTGIEAFFYDTASTDMTVTLYGQSLTGCGFTKLAEVLSAGTSGYYSKSTTSVSFSTIDNTRFAYHIKAYSTGWSSTLRIKGVVISYTLSEAP